MHNYFYWAVCSRKSDRCGLDEWQCLVMKSPSVTDTGFKPQLVNPGEGTAEGPQAAGVYRHVMGMAGAYLTGVMTGGRIVGEAAGLIEALQNLPVIGNRVV